MYIVLDKPVDSSLIDMHGTNNICNHLHGSEDSLIE
jgi:hypothetical protein